MNLIFRAIKDYGLHADKRIMKIIALFCLVFASKAWAGTRSGKGVVIINSHTTLPRPIYKMPLEQRMEGLEFFLYGEFPRTLTVSRFSGGADWPMEGIDPRFDNPDFAQCVVAKAPIADTFLGSIDFSKVSVNQFEEFNVETRLTLDELDVPQDFVNKYTYRAVAFPNGVKLGPDQFGFRIKNFKDPEKIYDILCDLTASSQSGSTKKPLRSVSPRYGYSLREAISNFRSHGLSLKTKSKKVVQEDWDFFKQHYRDFLVDETSQSKSPQPATH